MDWQDRALNILIYGLCLFILGRAIFGTVGWFSQRYQSQIECEADPNLLMAQGEWCVETITRAELQYLREGVN